ncbi:MAG TPA: divalent-cation tolerance protein CutA [Stackebrandtia sp.]|uniref:divalent-cation tolerance protein CutA n=1 Tax=Stackebrandtia sp. TaxID=2023065 RepID=UPI002D2BA2A2|nr:divalent-cation tolerance protein CutA [Stackebrandtia sp.]HZE40554.1 divalent-cation tolerance protein CutA [Stackebrandtia sp.]
MSKPVQITVTAPSLDIAESLARGLVEARLAACAQASGPLTSVYRWEGAVATDPEWRLDIKTSSALIDRVTAHVTAHHPYDVPEVIATEIVGGSSDYLEWIFASVGEVRTSGPHTGS